MTLITESAARLNDADTVLYEIYMLRFAALRLKEENWRDPKDAWVYLEAFLIHYRNLIEFLGNVSNPRLGDCEDLDVRTIWEKRLRIAKPAIADKIRSDGEELYRKYEKSADRISRYVSHCTTRRTEAKEWRIDLMNNEIEPLISEVEALLRYKRDNRILQPQQAVQFLGPADASTTVSTSTANVHIPTFPSKKDSELL